MVLNFAESGQAPRAEAHLSQSAPPEASREPRNAHPNATRTLAYVAAGTGAAGLLTFGVLGAMNNARFHDLTQACPGGQCPSDRQEDADAGRRLQTYANVGLAVGIVGLVTGGVLFVASAGKGGDRVASKSATLPALRADLGYDSVFVTGTF